MVLDMIHVRDVEELGDGNYSVRLFFAGGGTEISNTETVSAASHEIAIQKAKQRFARLLKMAGEVGTKLAARTGPQS